MAQMDAANVSPSMAHRMPMPPKHRKHHKAVSAKVRGKTAVVRVKGAPPSGQKFPIPDKAHARAALARINQAKPPLTAAQKAAVRRRAAAMLGKEQ